MSTLENLIPQSLNGLSVEAGAACQNTSAQPDARRLGSMKGYKFVADGHEIDDYDDEITRMFETMTE